jgi:RepB DNA-primase from phage plasmid
VTPSDQENPKAVSSTEYIQENFRPSDRVAILLRNRAHTVQRIVMAARITEPSFAEWLHDKNDKERYDIYVGMNALKPGARTRTKQDIHTVRHLYLDLDEDGPAALAGIRESNLVPANYTINTSPGKYQLVWRVENVSPEQAEALLRAMARTFGGDPAATDATRVLRIPGFKNRKYETEFLVEAEKHSDRVYQLLDFPLGTEPGQSEVRPRRPRPTPRLSEPRPLTQSEHDWAYAKRALSRGDDPEEIVRRIADYRADDKHDPLYYARLTVSKAQAESRASGERAPRDLNRDP